MFSAAVCTLHRGGSFLYGILTMEVGHHASEATLMTMFPLMGLRLSFGIVAETANIQMGEAEDFWAKQEARGSGYSRSGRHVCKPSGQASRLVHPPDQSGG